jgi:hypothetical protein
VIIMLNADTLPHISVIVAFTGSKRKTQRSRMMDTMLKSRIAFGDAKVIGIMCYSTKWK